PDFGIDDQHLDRYLFGRYDDFALTGTGIVYITAWVHDIAFKFVDNMGNVLPASNTEVTLLRPNGPDVTRAKGVNPDQFQSNLAWSYSQLAGADTGYAIFYQLPGDEAYGVRVTFDDVVVYDEPIQIEKLVKTVIETVVVRVFKLKLAFVDCNGVPLENVRFRYIDQNGATQSRLAGREGSADFG
ncbi:MAG: hypothetical protein NZ733_06605, partial [Aigarchaeota archaeon]|nr:hypothetical protein [Aigarchaeota archaeon]